MRWDYNGQRAMPRALSHRLTSYPHSFRPVFIILSLSLSLPQLRRFGPVDLVAEIIMWLLYANFSDQMDLDATR